MVQELTYYRRLIMKTLCSDQEIVDLILDKEDSPVPNRDLMYSRIFPYAYVPDVTKETDTFICFRIYVPEVRNKTYKEMNVVFYVFTHQSHLRMTDGLRTDMLSHRIEQLFNGSMELGIGRMQLAAINDISPATNFHGLSLSYTVTEFNRPSVNGTFKIGEMP